jgi:type VI secretion system protein ImpG
VRPDLLERYQNELTFLRQMGAEFAREHPGVASRLLLEPDRCADPHVERLLEGFSFLAARIHLKLEDELPEITESLIEVLYPHFLRPLPSMSIVELKADPEQGKLSTGIPVPRQTLLYSRAVDGVRCRFRTCYDATLWPLRVQAAAWRSCERLDPPVKAPEAFTACNLRLACEPDVKFQTLELNSLRLFLDGEARLIHSLYELLANNCLRVLLRNPKKPEQRPTILSAGSLRPMGFTDSESMMPYPRRSFAGYRLLQEYFAFPEKFFFLELNGLDAIRRGGFDDQVEIVFLISSYERSDRQQTLERGVNERTFKLGCTPIINLFAHNAEPVLLQETRYEYPVVPDFRRPNALEVFSIEEVLTSNADRQEITYYQPFYAVRHGREANRNQMYWHSMRRPSTRAHDEGTEVYLALLNSEGEAVRSGGDTLTVHCTCSNRDIAARIPYGNESGDFEIEGASVVKRIVSLRKPTQTLRPPVRKGLHWRLLSHLSLNYLSLVEEGRGALQEILRLYNYSDSAFNNDQIQGINALTSRRHFARVVSEQGISFARGIRVELELNEDLFVGGGIYLFASVLECFLGLYTSLNSFSQLVVRTTKGRKGILREWKPRAGQRILL